MKLPKGSCFLFGPRGTGKSTWIEAELPDALRVDLLDQATVVILPRAEAQIIDVLAYTLGEAKYFEYRDLYVRLGSAAGGMTRARGRETESATTAVDGKTYQAKYFKLDVIIGLKPSVFIDDQRDPGEAEMEVGRPARVDAEHLHDVEPHRIGQGQILVREPAQQADSTGMFLDTDGNDLQWMQILDERGELQRAGPIEPPEKPAVAFGEHERRRH